MAALSGLALVLLQLMRRSRAQIRSNSLTSARFQAIFSTSADAIIVTNRGGWIDKRHVVDGVFETYRELNDNEGELVGSSPPEWFWKYSPKTKEPRAGEVWAGRVAETTDTVTYGDEMKAYHNRGKSKWTAEYRFLENKDAKISGFTYATVAVEAVFSGAGGTRSLRFIYFPKLYLGIETKRDGVANGITGLTAV